MTGEQLRRDREKVAEVVALLTQPPMSQRALSRIVNVSDTTVGAWKDQRNPPEGDAAERLAVLFTFTSTVGHERGLKTLREFVERFGDNTARALFTLGLNQLHPDAPVPPPPLRRRPGRPSKRRAAAGVALVLLAALPVAYMAFGSERAREKGVEIEIAHARKVAEYERTAKDLRDALARKTEDYDRLARKMPSFELAQRTGPREDVEDELREALAHRTAEYEKLARKTAVHERRAAEYERYVMALRSEMDASRLELTELRGRTTVKVKEEVLFASASASIPTGGYEVLRGVADELRSLEGKAIRVEGHADRAEAKLVPGLETWGLSVARAVAVLRFLEEQGVPPTRLEAVGHGDSRPRPSGETDQSGGAHNRRVEIVIVPAGHPG